MCMTKRSRSSSHSNLLLILHGHPPLSTVLIKKQGETLIFFLCPDRLFGSFKGANLIKSKIEVESVLNHDISENTLWGVMEILI